MNSDTLGADPAGHTCTMNTKQKPRWYRVTAKMADSGQTLEWKTRSEARALEIAATAKKCGELMYSSVVITPPGNI